MSVQRYDVTLNHADSDDPEAAMTRHVFGSYVRHQDYAALEAKCAALAADNAGLKDEISNITFMRDDDFFGSTQRAQEVMGRLVNVKTPATDAFLAEVWAQGVEMFAESQKEYVRKNRGELDSMTRAAYCGSAVDAERFATQLRKEVI